MNYLAAPPFALCMLLTAWFAMDHGALAAPGEDPMNLSGPVEHLSLPGPPAPKSGNLEGSMDMPAWMKARIARYEAKSFSASADDGTLLTDNNVVNTANAQGLRKTCVQEVGSSSSSGGTSASGGSFNRYGPNNQQQIVVLRGDLVNICK